MFIGWINRHAAFYNHWTTRGLYRESILENSISRRMSTRFPLGPENTVQHWLPTFSKFFPLISAWKIDSEVMVAYYHGSGMEDEPRIMIPTWNIVWQRILSPYTAHQSVWTLSLSQFPTEVLSMWKVNHAYLDTCLACFIEPMEACPCMKAFILPFYFYFFGLFEEILIKIKPIKTKWS